MSKDCDMCPQFLKVHYKITALILLLGVSVLGDCWGIWKENKIYNILIDVNEKVVRTDQRLTDHLNMDKTAQR
jgi:hypothetical protein